MKFTKASIVIGTLLAAVGSGAFAGGAHTSDVGTEGQDFSNFKSTKTRAEVMAEYQQAREQGLLMRGDADVARPVQFKSTRSRDEVRAEAIAAAKERKVNPDYNSNYNYGG